MLQNYLNFIATKPGQTVIQQVEKKKDRGFKTATDGRLIIKDDSDDSDDDHKKGISLESDSDSGEIILECRNLCTK